MATRVVVIRGHEERLREREREREREGLRVNRVSTSFLHYKYGGLRRFWGAIPRATHCANFVSILWKLVSRREFVHTICRNTQLWSKNGGLAVVCCCECMRIFGVSGGSKLCTILADLLALVRIIILGFLALLKCLVLLFEMMMLETPNLHPI